jgi:hypothetical protein
VSRARRERGKQNEQDPEPPHISPFAGKRKQPQAKAI